MEKRSKLNLNIFGSIKPILLLFLILMASACSNEADVIDTSNIQIDLKINRIDRELFESSNPDDIQKLIDNHPKVFNDYLELNKLPHDSILVGMLFKRIQDKNVDSFYRQCDSIFGNFESQEDQLESLFKHTKYYFPEFVAPEVNTIFTAFLTPTDIIINKDQIIIGLDYFLGENAMYVQNDPLYILGRYTPDKLVPLFVGLGVSNFFNATNFEDASLVAEMIYHGKAHYFLSKMGIEMDQYELMGYTEDEHKYLQDNENKIWAYFIENSLLFETNRMETSKFISERPKVVEISSDCPGRVGRWIGHRIVSSYVKKNNVNLRELMFENDAQKIFRNSGYNPSF